MTDLIAIAARAAADRLATEHNSGLAADVEAALQGRGTTQRPNQYLDPVSLGSLIVAIATLAWTIYSDQRRKTREPPPELIARHVRAELRRESNTYGEEIDRITEIIITEIIQADRDLRLPYLPAAGKVPGGKGQAARGLHAHCGVGARFPRKCHGRRCQRTTIQVDLLSAA
jgi:hypothetical protein